MRREPPSSTSRAFAPGAITNFFSIHYANGRSDPRALLGATGGGYVLSRGVVSEAVLSSDEKKEMISTTVNGDDSYDARTTRRAVKLLIESYHLEFDHLHLNQFVDIPIGAGFGASAASALSAVYSVASLFKIPDPKSKLARFAHDAEIQEQTGLGTVSVIYDGTGAGAITEPGIPGVARFLNVEASRSTRIVTAVQSPYDKRDVFSSPSISERIVRLGNVALNRVRDEPTMENLALCGDWFSETLGLESDGVRAMEAAALNAGALHASQNMIGLAVHALTTEEGAPIVAEALRRSNGVHRVDVFEVGSVAAGPF